MFQIATFVDAGYLFAQGSALCAGQKQPRTSVSLSVQKVLEHLANAAESVAPAVRLLRVYWYDGLLRGGGLSIEQSEIAHARNVKLRLGLVNSRGQQKGVDSLIVTDLIDLARNQAISDALIVSGDEDIRVGVQVAQTFGVRIHLLGIKPALGSQSLALIQEADTHHEWTEETVRSWMTVSDRVKSLRPLVPPVAEPESVPIGSFEAEARAESKVAVGSLDATQLGLAVDYMKSQGNRIPPEVDRPTLARLRNRLDRELTEPERKRYREILGEEFLAEGSKSP